MNDEGTAVSFPEYRYGSEAAVAYVNAHGGINGHPITLVKCIADGTPAASVNCANKFVDQHVLAEFAAFDAGADSALPALDSAGIPFISENAWGPKESTDPNSFLLLPAGTAVDAAAILEASKLGSKRIGHVIYAIPEQQQTIPQSNKQAASLGMTSQAIETSATSPDFLTAATTAIANHDDAMIGFFTESTCTNFVKATRSAGFTGPIIAGSCSDYVKALGSQAENTYAIYQTYSPSLASEAPAAIQKQLSTYTAAMGAAGHADIVNGLARNAFSAWMDLVSVLKGVNGPITSASIKSALASANNVPGFMGPDVNCAAHPWKEEPQACSAEVIVVKVAGGANGPKLTTTGSYLNVAAINS